MFETATGAQPESARRPPIAENPQSPTTTRTRLGPRQSVVP